MAKPRILAYRTAAWNYVAATQYMLGIRPDYDGLRIQPCLPENWSGYTATRIFRGATYRITVDRDGPGNQLAAVVDGKPIQGNLFPLAAPGKNS